MFVNEIEKTGPVVRVWVAGVEAAHDRDEAAGKPAQPHDLEDEALALAREAVGDVSGVRAEVEFHMQADVFEVIFEAGDLA